MAEVAKEEETILATPVAEAEATDPGAAVDTSADSAPTPPVDTPAVAVAAPRTTVSHRDRAFLALSLEVGPIRLLSIRSIFCIIP